MKEQSAKPWTAKQPSSGTGLACSGAKGHVMKHYNPGMLDEIKTQRSMQNKKQQTKKKKKQKNKKKTLKIIFQ